MVSPKSLLSDYDLDNFASLSEPQHGTVAECIAEEARRLGIAVVYGYSEVEKQNQYYNSLMFIDDTGKHLANYRKVHVWPGTEDLHYKAGHAPVVVNWGGVKVGLAICVDVCMSEFITTMVADGGAQLIVVATALVDHPLYQKSPLFIVPTRSLENRCFIAYTDLAGKKYSGMSRMCNPCGECIVSSNTSEEVLLLATISLEDCESVPFRYHSLRRPNVYIMPYATEMPWKKEGADSVNKFFKGRAHYYDRQMEGMYNAPLIAAQALSSYIQRKRQENFGCCFWNRTGREGSF